ncbi:MAG: ATP-binding protein [Negativicutes bacterium]|nr:ATP-binding protein [Negativicutes bacterium]
MRGFAEIGKNRLPYRGWTSYLVAIIIIIVSLLVREVFLPSLGRSLPYVTFYPAVLVVALYGGFAAGLVATGCSILVVLFLVVGVGQLSSLSQMEWLVHAAYPLFCVMISYCCEAMYRAWAEDKTRNNQLFELTKELTQQKQKYQTLVENLPDMITRFDREFRHIYANPALEKVSDREVAEVIGKTWKELGNPPEMYQPLISRFERVFATKQSIEYNSVYDSQYGTKYYHNIVVPELGNDGNVQTVLVVTRDVTLQKQTENEILRLDRLNVIGEMAASIGHEIRNPLTTVRGYLQMFGMKETFADHKDQFNMMIEELDRANFIITEFLSLSKRKAVELEYGNLNDNIKGIVPLLQVDALYTGHNIKVELNEIPDIAMDKKEIVQILLNLVRNGVEATPPGGTITVKTGLVDGQVVLSVQDTGHGISKEIMDKLGTPFVTTKETGTGLGLPVCYRIAERHNAKMEVDTGSHGTTFFVKFNQSA